MASKVLSDDVWSLIEPLIPQQEPSPKGGRPRIGDRQILIGILFVLRTDIPWEDLPEELGSGCGTTCMRRLRQWQEEGVWPQIEAVLRENLAGANRYRWDRILYRSSNPDMRSE